MGKLQATVWSHWAGKDQLIPWKISVAQKLMAGHIKDTVTPERTSVTKSG